MPHTPTQLKRILEEEGQGSLSDSSRPPLGDLPIDRRSLLRALRKKPARWSSRDMELLAEARLLNILT